MAQGLVGSDAYLEQWRWGDVQERDGRPTTCSTRSSASSKPSTREHAATLVALGVGVTRARSSSPASRATAGRSPAARRRTDRDVLRLRRDDARRSSRRSCSPSSSGALFSERTKGTPAAASDWNLLELLRRCSRGAALSRADPAHRLRAAPAQARRSSAQKPAAGAGRRKPASRRQERPQRAHALGRDRRSSSCCSAATAVVLLASRQREARAAPVAVRPRGEAVSLALDESLDDLRNDPDLRRAIVAAYARMERALGRVGLAAAARRRRRSSTSSGRSRASTRAPEPSERLTTLFEWAKFSQHEPEPGDEGRGDRRARRRARRAARARRGGGAA